MEANLVRILLLIALFFLLSSDYSSVVKQVIPIWEDSEEETDNTSDSADLGSRIKVEKQRVEEPVIQSTAKIAEDAESKLLIDNFRHIAPDLIGEPFGLFRLYYILSETRELRFPPLDRVQIHFGHRRRRSEVP